MGIRFQCPNGHKLNVKVELAGKRAVCPSCGAKLVIPAESRAGSAAANGSPLEHDASVVLPLEVGAAVAAGSAAGATIPVPTPPPPPSAGVVPEAPVAGGGQATTWYVRPSSGGQQYGPATDELFSEWILQHRVLADAYVWRDGWPDWKLVRDVSAALPVPLPATETTEPAVTPPPIGDAGTVAAAASGEPSAPPQETGRSNVEPEPPTDAAGPGENQSASWRYAARRRRAKRVRLNMAVLMIVVAIVLAVVLVWVVRRNAVPTTSARHGEATQLALVGHNAYGAGDLAAVAGRLVLETRAPSSAL